MTNLIRIKSDAPMAFIISEPHPDPSQPGKSPVLKSDTLYPGINEDVDADLWKAWCDAVPDHPVLVNKVAYQIDKDDPGVEYGHEPALKRAIESDDYKAATEGSTNKSEAPLKADDLRNETKGPDPLPANSIAKQANESGTNNTGPASVVSKTPLKVPATSDMKHDGGEEKK